MLVVERCREMVDKREEAASEEEGGRDVAIRADNLAIGLIGESALSEIEQRQSTTSDRNFKTSNLLWRSGCSRSSSGN